MTTPVRDGTPVGLPPKLDWMKFWWEAAKGVALGVAAIFSFAANQQSQLNANALEKLKLAANERAQQAQLHQRFLLRGLRTEAAMEAASSGAMRRAIGHNLRPGASFASSVSRFRSIVDSRKTACKFHLHATRQSREPACLPGHFAGFVISIVKATARRVHPEREAHNGG